MPRSFSRSIESRNWSSLSRSLRAPQVSRMRSAKVVLPWSMCAMIEKLRIRSAGNDMEGPGCSTSGDVWLRGARRTVRERQIGLAGEIAPVLVEDEIDPLPDVLGDRHLGPAVEELELLVLLRRDVH